MDCVQSMVGVETYDGGGILPILLTMNWGVAEVTECGHPSSIAMPSHSSWLGAPCCLLCRLVVATSYVVVATLQRVTIHRQWIDSVSWHYSTANRRKNEQIYATKRSPLACWYNGNDTFVIIKNRSRMEDKIAKRMLLTASQAIR